jgi:Dynein heavy chain, N-terminal region 1
MTNIISPLMLSNHTWPDTVRKDVHSALHKFMASLIEHVNDKRGQTVLYIPRFSCTDAANSARHKNVTQLMESCIIHATRQVKEVLNKQDDLGDNSGPLQEINFWRARNADLCSIRHQLDSDACQDIVAVCVMLSTNCPTRMTQHCRACGLTAATASSKAFTYPGAEDSKELIPAAISRVAKPHTA